MIVLCVDPVRTQLRVSVKRLYFTSSVQPSNTTVTEGQLISSSYSHRVRTNRTLGSTRGFDCQCPPLPDRSAALRRAALVSLLSRLMTPPTYL